MKNSDVIFYFLKQFYNYYRLPLSVINKKGETLYCFPQSEKQYILPPVIMQDELNHYVDSHIDYYTPFLVNAPYDSFIGIIPLPTKDFLFVGPSFSRPFSLSRIENYSNMTLKKADLESLQEMSRKLPLVDESYLTDALSLLVLLLHYKEITPQEILLANNLTHTSKTIFDTTHILDSEYETLLLFEAQVQTYVQSGQAHALSKLWSEFSVSVKDELMEHMYSEHHLMIPLLSTARHAALSGGAQREDVLSIFHSTISQISSRGSLPVNLKIVERATLDLCNLVKKNKSIPFRTNLCIQCEHYIDEHLGEKITAADIADYCGVDRSLVFDIFRKNYNTSLTEYIQEKRMKRAEVLLLHSTTPISELATSLGFCSSSYFSKVFFSYFKCTPTEYRNLKKVMKKSPAIMTSVKIRNTIIGEGIPKICVPIVGVTKEDILAEARSFDSVPVDIVEWRADWFEDVFDIDKVLEILKELRGILGDLPLLTTFRTFNEGGKKSISHDAYTEFNLAVAQSGYVDLIDVEVFTGDDIVKNIIKAAHAVGVKVIASNHDFTKTPDKEDIISRLRKMQDLDADISKIAVMPQCKKDVLTLLLATEEMASQYADRPIITMSMAEAGIISRLCGEVFGSAITFGALKKPSAPGQMGVDDLKFVLELLHDSL